MREQASFTGDRMSRRQYRHHLHNPRAVMLLAQDGKRITGSALLLFRRDSQAARLYSIAVDPQARGRGVGRALLAACEQRAAGRGCTQLRLEVRADNRAAQTLYQHAGYCRRGLRAGYYEDGGDAWLMEKTLAAPPD